MKTKTKIVGVALSALMATAYLQWAVRSEPIASMAECQKRGCASPLIAGFKGLHFP